MEYQNIDEVTRREACEKVKQIAEIIKKIRKKYYLCFNKISDVDKQRYDKLKDQMQVFANKNGYGKYSAELIADIETQYNDNIPNESEEQDNHSREEIHKQYLTAVSLQAELTIMADNSTDVKLKNLYLKKAKKVQDHIKRMLNILEKYNNKIELIREKQSVLSQKFGEQTKIYFNDVLKTSYGETSKDPLAQKSANYAIEECIERDNAKTSQTLIR